MHKRLIFSTGPVCGLCEKICTEMKNLILHRHCVQKIIHVFLSRMWLHYSPKSNLNRHMKRHVNTPATSNFRLKVARRHDSIPNLTDPPVIQWSTPRTAWRWRNSIHVWAKYSTWFWSDTNDSNGCNLTCRDSSIFQDELLWATYQNFRQVYMQNFHHIHYI